MIKVETINSAVQHGTEGGERVFYAELNPGYWWKPGKRYWFEIHDHNYETGVNTTWAYEEGGSGYANSVRSAMLKIYAAAEAFQKREWLDEYGKNNKMEFEETDNGMYRAIFLRRYADKDGNDVWIRDDETELYAAPEFIDDLEEIGVEPDTWERMQRSIKSDETQGADDEGRGC
jgi:hypothetical protein